MTKRVLLLLSLSAFAACTDTKPALTRLPQTTLSFQPSEYTLQEFTTQCNTGPFAGSSSLYSLSLVGDANEPTRSLINFAWQPGLTQGQALAVALNAFGIASYTLDANGNKTNVVYGQSGSLPGTGNSFEWSQGTNPTELDSTALNSVMFTIDGMPSGNGDDGVFTIDMQFQDGGVYDVRVAAPLMTSVSGCPAG